MIIQWAKKVFLASADMVLPALCFAIGVFFYCDRAVTYTNEADILHIILGVLFFSWLLVLYFSKNSKDSLLVLLIFSSYLAINGLKKQYGAEFNITSYYYLLNVVIVINWLLYLISDFFKLSKKYDFYLLCIFLASASIVENNALFDISSYKYSIILLLWSIFCLSYLIYVSLYPNIKNYGTFFAFLSCGLGLLYSDSSLALSLYFSCAVLILLSTTIYSLVYNYFRDPLTGINSRNTYLRQCKNFPLKYSLGIICIDDYNKLLKVFGPRGVDCLTKMLVSKIKESSSISNIYRYNDDEFILIFNNEDKKTSYEYLENIRRSIAISEFVLNSKQTVKLTISAGVSEKKRSDANVEPVLMRACEAVQRTYKFTQNMTSIA